MQCDLDCNGFQFVVVWVPDLVVRMFFCKSVLSPPMLSSLSALYAMYFGIVNISLSYGKVSLIRATSA